MAVLSTGDGQAVADLPQALGLSKLTKEHGHLLVPRREPFGVPLRPALTNHERKRVPRHYLEDLTEQACGKLHGRDSFAVVGDLAFSPYYFAESLYYSP